MDLDGSNNTLISDIIATNLIYNDGYIYYINFITHNLERMNVLTNNIETLNSGEHRNFNILNNQIICSSASAIDILNLNGELIDSITSKLSLRDTYLSLTERYIFYKRFGTNTIWMINRQSNETVVVVEEHHVR